LDFGPALYFHRGSYPIIHLFAEKWSAVALDKDILRGFQRIEGWVSQGGDREHNVELKHGDTAEIFWTLRPRCEGPK